MADKHSLSLPWWRHQMESFPALLAICEGNSPVHISKWQTSTVSPYHDDVIKWNHSPRYWPFVRGIHRSPVNSPHKGHWRGALVFSLICALNKRLSEQSWGWWFETQSCSLWRHCNVPRDFNCTFQNYLTGLVSGKQPWSTMNSN